MKPSPVRIDGSAAWNDATDGYFAFVTASSSASACPARDEKPAYQMSNGSSGRPSRFSMTAARSFTSFEREDGDEQLFDLLLGDLPVELEPALDERRSGRAVRVGLTHRAEDVEELLVARVGLARCRRAPRCTGST